MGRATKVADGRSTTLYTYTATGRLKSVVDALGNETAYTYDSLDNLKNVHRAEGRIENKDDRMPVVGEDGHVTLYSNDLSGQLTTITDALGQEETYEYDQYGRLKTKIDRDNYNTTYSYNNLGALTKVSYGDGRSVEFAYNELNQLKQINDWLGTTSIERDSIDGGSYHGAGKYGYADIIVFNDTLAEIYEIKPGSYASGAVNHAAGVAQLDGYVTAFNDPMYENTDRRGAIFASPGMSYDSTFSIAMQSTFRPGEYIVYRTYGDGLIIYDYQKKIPDNCEVVEPTKEAVLKSLQYYLHVSDETMNTIENGAIVGGIIVLAVLIGVLVADDFLTFGLGTADDSAIVPLATMLLNYIRMLLSNGTPCFE